MIGLQIVFAVCLFIFVSISYLLPVILTKRKLDKQPQNEKHRIQRIVTSCCNCLSAGVFIAMFFLGLLPNVRRKIDLIFHHLDVTSNFPATECIIVLGYFLTLTMQQLVLMCQKGHHDTHILLSNSTEFEQRKGLLNEFELDSLSPSSASHDEINLASLPDTSKSIPNVPKIKSPTISHFENRSNIQHDHHGHMALLTQQTSCLNFVVLIMVTSIHALFEGTTLALQTTTQNALHLFIAILVHECLVALALGLNTSRLKLPLLSVIKFSLIFSLALPVGVAFGLIIGKTPGLAGDIISALVQGIAAGTFLHVTFQELIPSEFNQPSQRLLKLFFLLLGFVFFALVTFFLMNN